MSTQTEHLNLDLREASDIFNPLSTNANFETLDSVIYDIQTKGGVPTYTTTASANLLKLSDNPTPNVTVFKFVAAGDANTWSYQETVNNIISLDGTQKTVKAGEMYVAWVNSANAMVVIAWPDVVNAQTFDGKGPTEWATTAQLQAVNTTATNATTTAQAAATVANNALEVANAAGMHALTIWKQDNPPSTWAGQTVTPDSIPEGTKFIAIIHRTSNSNTWGTTIIAWAFEKKDYIGQNKTMLFNPTMGAGFGQISGRSFYITGNDFVFDNGMQCNAWSTIAQQNQACIPIEIIAIY